MVRKTFTNLLLISFLFSGFVTNALAQNRAVIDTRPANADVIPTDAGVLVFNKTFDDTGDRKGAQWNHKLAVIGENCGVNNSKCLDVSFVPTKDGSERVVFSIPLKPDLEYSLNFDIRFGENFEFTKGGKLIGFGPDKYITGCRPNQVDGWSQRIMFDRDGTLFNYSYHQNRKTPQGCGDSLDKRRIKLDKDSYNAITLHMKVNSTADAADGFSRIYVNGKLASSVGGLQYRAVPGGNTQITQLLFSSFHGGSDTTWSPSRTVHAYYDNISVIKGRHIRTHPGEIVNTGISPDKTTIRITADPECRAGISGKNACCPVACGSCGGPGCSARPGGAKACCEGPILESSVSCKVSGPPCVLGN